MGAGASSFDHASEEQGPASSTNGFGEIAGREYEAASEEQKALMAQAQAHWHRMIIHANNANNKPVPPMRKEVVEDKKGDDEESRVQSAIDLYKNADKTELDHKADDIKDEIDFDKALQSRLAPLDESAIIERSNSNIVLQRTVSGDPLPFNMQRSPSIKSSKSSTNLRPNDESDNSTPSPKPRRSHSHNNFGSDDIRSQIIKNDIPQDRPSTSSQVASFKRQPRITPECLNAISLLPPVRVDLRSRTGVSLSLVWDSDMEALIALRKVVDKDGLPITPRYEVTYRKADYKSDFEALYDHTIQANKSRKWQWLDLEDPTRTRGTIHDLEPNTQYSIRCRRMQWSEDWGVTVTVRTGPGPPAAVENLHAKEVSSSSILVAWEPPATDNGLPVLYYVVRKKKLGGEFEFSFKGKERLYLAVDLVPNSVYVFEVLACNRVGEGNVGNRLATRTLQPGAAAMTPWMEAIDRKTGKLFFKHPKTDATAWTLPKGSVLDATLSLQNKINYLKECIKIKQTGVRERLNPDRHQLKMNVNRHNILEESLGFLRLSSTEELLAGPMKVTFVNESGVDGGGLAREWAVEFIKALVTNSSGLFKMDDNGSGALIDVRAETLHGSECRWLFAAIAKMFAKCIVDGLVLGVRFSRLFLSWLTAKPPTLDDLHDMDASMYRGLQWVLHNDVTDMDLTFSASYELLDAQHTVNLVPNGASKTVTEGNKRQYVDLMMAWLIRGRFEPAVTHFVDSFHSVLPPNMFEHFTLSQMQLLISGSPEVDINLLQQEACYTGEYSMDTAQVQWFWEILRQDFTGQEVSILLAFITGCPCVPHGGLKPPLTVTMVECVDGESTEYSPEDLVEKRDSILPRSHTCFHQIVMPLYSSKEKMIEKLLYALKNTDGGGFHLA